MNRPRMMAARMLDHAGRVFALADNLKRAESTAGMVARDAKAGSHFRLALAHLSQASEHLRLSAFEMDPDPITGTDGSQS